VKQGGSEQKPNQTPKSKKRGDHLFKKGQSGNPGGRPKKTVTWQQAEDALREALPRVLLMTETERRELIKANPTGAESLAIKFYEEVPARAIERFLGKMAQPLTGANDSPLIPNSSAILPVIAPMDFKGWTKEQVDEFIKATGASAEKKS
jgi:hypothetical protein